MIERSWLSRSIAGGQWPIGSKSGDRVGISTAYWYQIEKGERQYITEDVLRGIERVLGVDLGVSFND